MKKYRVWHIPKVDGDPFYVDVDSPTEGKKIMDILVFYDLFTFSQGVRTNYTYKQGLEVFEDGKWREWHDKYGRNIDNSKNIGVNYYEACANTLDAMHSIEGMCPNCNNYVIVSGYTCFGCGYDPTQK